ncbi:CapA family protein [Microbulbifer harenosus]|uniref:UDP-N-acetylmuramoyl-tripeptide--D-alanyl-D-alanine ligase n=1 Tax=Microbulbifer harenosus TaxID=2576840 RepID=A0ABY2UK13_9GAMM|nr:CapA family protein [Microbulbifer harenosus]TLM78411.1 UDP-N-acetylmuramoyl-tripeptide--D-alanyl-D-alanine ligase [Microbulbifer harenosus]
MATSGSFSELLSRARPVVERQLAKLTPPYTLFFSASDGKRRARVCHGRGQSTDALWLRLATQIRKLLASEKMDGRWLRIDWVTDSETTTWRALQQQFENTKRGYFRYGLALDANWKTAFLEQELNGNAMLYGGNKVAHVAINQSQFRAYTDFRFGRNTPLEFSDDRPVTILHTEGLFLDGKTEPRSLYGPGRNAGRRVVDTLDEPIAHHLITTSSRYLASQVRKNGRFDYGWHCCFDRPIDTYNTLRHASSTYALTEGWEVTGDEQTRCAIDRAIAYLTGHLIKTAQLPCGTEAAFLVEANGEIKLGGNAVCLLALVKYSELTGSSEHEELLEKLALGIRFMQDQGSGKFVHVLQYPELTLKEEFRIIYYDGEAAFGLMRLYGHTRDERWLNIVEKAFEYFIANNHWQAHDHWLSYCVNELTLYRPQARYYQFGLQNVIGHLDFILERITTFPTLLELMMAAERMVARLRKDEEFSYLLAQMDLHKFYRALHSRAMYLLNGYFWPEYAMYFANPAKITGSFFIRHHAFRVRIDDVEHYLSGFVAFRKYLLRGGCPIELSEQIPAIPQSEKHSHPTLAWGGDVNLARRQHYRAEELGHEEAFGRIPALSNADLSVINLECVVATTGEQGVEKGERSPYYYRARPDMLRLLCKAKIDVVTTANNHVGDYGNQALLEQGYWLDCIGIGHTGSGVNIDVALTPVIRPAGNLNVAIFSLDATQETFAAGSRKPGSAYLPLYAPESWMQYLQPRIAAARKAAHVVIVAVHWGNNLEETPSAEEIKVGHCIIDAGADAVLGASAHILQGIEVYKDRPIIHDAGDLLFDAVRKTLKDSGIFQLSLSHRGVEQVRFIPVGSGFGFSRQLSGEAATAAARRFIAKCEALGAKLQLHEDGSGLLQLAPPERAKPLPPPAPAARTRYNPKLLDSIQPPLHPYWHVREVPEDAKIAPRTLGPLRLLGIRVSPTHIEHRQPLWVESFWTLEQPVSDNLRLDIRAVPTEATDMPHWGKSMDHDPCDWQVPTSRWQLGVIYRDYYGLRPPQPGQLKNINLRLEIGLSGKTLTIPPQPLDLGIITVKIPELDARANARNSHSNGVVERSKPPVYRSDFPAVTFRQSPGKTWDAEQITMLTGGTWLVPPPEDWFVCSVVSGQGFIAQSQSPVMFVAHKSHDRAYHERSSITKYSRWDLHDRLPEIVRTAGQLLGGVIVARPVEGLPPDLPVLQVADPIQAIIELGLAARQRYSGEVVAITGTSGKSSTLKMLSCLLGGRDKVLTSLGNYNSRVGVPSMLASLNQHHDAAVVEIAQSALWMKQGPITQRVPPTIALITEIGVSQTTSRVKTDRDTAKWKSRIFDGLSGRATAVIGEHLPHFDYILGKARQHAKRVVTYGNSERAEVQIREITTDQYGSRLALHTPREDIEIYVPVPSMGMARNAVAALTVLYAMGKPLANAASALGQLTLDEGHLDQIPLNLPRGSAMLIDDSWNATVSSMLNAFSVLAQTPMPSGGRKVAALGRIVELGDQAAALHRSLARPLIECGIEKLITHGEEMHFLRSILPEKILGPHFNTAKDMAYYLIGALQDKDLLLVKGSRRDSDFGAVPKLLQELAATNAPTEVATRTECGTGSARRLSANRPADNCWFPY